MLSTPRLRIVRLAVFVAAGALVSPLQTAHAQAYLAGPSVVNVGETVTFAGGGYRPSDFVNVAVSPPPGSLLLHGQAQAHATNRTGNVEVNVVAGVAGVYVVTVTDSAGATLATAQFLVW